MDNSNKRKTRSIKLKEQVKVLDLKPLSDSHKTHTIKVQCKDTLGNLGDTNEIKFPPIIEFATDNKTLIKERDRYTGSFSIYSPSGNTIEGMKITDATTLGIEKVTCQ